MTDPKRYRMAFNDTDGAFEIPEPDGDWVKYDDVKHLLQAVDPTRCNEPGCGNMGTRADGKCGYHTLQGPCIGGCEHDWTNVVDVCKDKPCNGQILGRKCARCGEFDGSRVNRPLA